MPIQLSIECATPQEYREFVRLVARGLSESDTGPLPVHAWQMIPDAELRKRAEYEAERRERDAQFPPFTGNGAVDPASGVEDVTAQTVAQADSPAPDPNAPPPPPAKRSRGRPAKADPKPPEAHSAPAEAHSEPAEAHSEPAKSDPFTPEADPDPRQSALDLLRQLYEQPGLPLKVNELLSKYGVSKFTAIGPERGAELLADARKLEAANKAP